MTALAPDFARWLQDAAVAEAVLTPIQRALLEAAYGFLQRCGHDYYSVRMLSHFLLHCQAGFPVAHIARLLQLTRSAASAQQGLSSKEVVQAAHHRLCGRSHGKLLPRFAGPVAHFLHQHPDATRWDLLDFLRDHCGVSVSRMALYHFLKKYGLDGSGTVVTFPTPTTAVPAEPPLPGAPPLAEDTAPDAADRQPAQPTTPPPAHQPRPPADFFLPQRATLGPS
jgi:hypothetical protein